MPKLRSDRSRRQRWINWWVLWRIPVLLSVLMAGWWFAYRPFAESRAGWTAVSRSFDICGTRGRGFACVSDGDTLTLGYGPSARRIRLTGFDAPEIEGACAAETARAHEAERALQGWLNSGGFEWDGGADPPYDRYGRELRRVRRVLPGGGQEMLADFMIDAGLAEGPGPWEGRSWCG